MALLKDVAINSVLQLNESDANQVFRFIPKQNKTLLHPLKNVINYTHVENATNDFKRQPLLTSALSYSGPCMTKGDINNDGLEDLFIGGASGQAGKIFLQNKNGRFTAISSTGI